MPRKRFYDYEGKLALIRYEPKRCIHAEECVTGLPGVFERDRRPWIDPDQGSPQDVVDVVSRCPTGALQVERRDGGPIEAEPSQNIARVVADGPIYLEGRLQLQLALGGGGPERRVALCRCGSSRNKPFCDNSHLQAGFLDSGVLGVASMAPISEETGQSLELSTVPKGPILFQGALEVVGADDGESQTGRKGALCRCGASSNKPYCDGSHVAAGFEAD